MEDLPRYFELCVIHAWLKGKTRDEIAEEFGKSQGTVSNIITKVRNSLGRYDADAMRELAQELRELDMTPENCAIGCRVSKVLEKLKIPEEKIAEFLKEIFEFSEKMDIDTKILRDAILEFVKISREMPFSEVPSYLQQTREEMEQLENKKKKLKEEIEDLEKEKLATEEKTRSSLKDESTTLFHLDIFLKIKNKLESFGIPVEDTDKFARCVQGIKNYSKYDPFKVIEKFSELKTLEIEIEDNQKRKNDLEIHIEELKETESAYDDRLNIKYIKLKNLYELERIVGFSIQDLKKLKSILIEISFDHKNLDIEQVKALFFELLEKYETRIALESENNALLQLKNILENQIKSNRQILHCQKVFGPILKNLFDSGIEESDIVAINALLDIVLSNMGMDIAKLNEQREVINDLSSYSNLRLAKANLRRELNNILNSQILEKIQNRINEINKSSSINNPQNSNDRKQEVLCDSIF
jgi:transcriptional regulator with XRE-family HTH domain